MHTMAFDKNAAMPSIQPFDAPEAALARGQAMMMRIGHT